MFLGPCTRVVNLSDKIMNNPDISCLSWRCMYTKFDNNVHYVMLFIFAASTDKNSECHLELQRLVD